VAGNETVRDKQTDIKTQGMQVNARIASYVEWTLVYVFHIIAFFFDIFTYLPFYFIQEPKRALELSAR